MNVTREANDLFWQSCHAMQAYLVSCFPNTYTDQDFRDFGRLNLMGGEL